MPLLLLLGLKVLAVLGDQQRFTRQPVDVVARLGDTVGGGHQLTCLPRAAGPCTVL